MKKLLLSIAFPAFVLSAFSQNYNPCSNGAVIPADNCVNTCVACDLNGYSGNTAGFTAGVAPGFCGQVSAEQWFSFIAAENSALITLQPSNCTGGKGLQAALYADCNMAPIACKPGQPGGGNLPVSLFSNLNPGERYYLMVDGFNGDVCQFNITVTPSDATATPPISAPTGTIHGPSVVAPGSSIVYSVPPVPNADYYTWHTPPDVLINGQITPQQLPAPNGNRVTITFSQSSPFPVEVCVAPGNQCSTGSQSCLGITLTTSVPPVVCPGNSTPASDDCADACVHCSFFGYVGATGGYTPDYPSSDFCGTIENDQWFAFIAGDTAATFTAIPSNCVNGDGIQLGLLTACDGKPVQCSGGGAGFGDTPISISAKLVPGTTYYLLIDGFAGDECGFNLTVVPQIALQAPNVGVADTIEGPIQVCPGITVDYQVAPVPGAGAYIWTAPAGCTINGYNSPAYIAGTDGHQVQITFGNLGGDICVTPVNACSQSNSSTCLDVAVAPAAPTVLPDIIVCNEELPYELPWGELVSVSGTYQNTYAAWQGCDSIVVQKIIVKPLIMVNIGTKYLCMGGCITVCGDMFCDPGVYTQTCESYQGCDSMVTFSIVLQEPVADIIGNVGILTCAMPCVTLSSAFSPAPGIKTWRNSAGQIQAVGNNCTVCTPGTYILTTTMSGGGNSCVATDTIEVVANYSSASAFATGGALSCANPVISLDGSSDTPGATFSWSGPNNFVSNQEDPVVNIPGTYQLTVTHPASGCTTSATAEVISSSDFPLISLSSPILTCSNPAAFLTCMTNIDPAEFSWTGPTGFVSQDQNPVIAQPGGYTVTVTNPQNGCSNSATTIVTEDFNLPLLTATSDTLNCTHSSGTFQVYANTDANSAGFLWSGPNGFSSTSQNPAIQEPGTYYVTVTDLNNGCTSIASTVFEQDVEAPEVTAAGGTLTCAASSLLLACQTSAVVTAFSWNGPNGFTATVQNPAADQPGLYSVTVTNLINGCTNSATATVVSDMPVPLVKAEGGTLNCITLSVLLSVSTSADSVWYAWSGPSGFVSSEATPLVTQPGLYIVTVTDLSNGCTGTDETVVDEDLTPPLISATGGALNCWTVSVQLDGSIPPGITFIWNGPNFTSTEEDPVVTVPGIYTLTAVGSNDCISEVTALVEEDIIPPVIQLLQVTHDHNGQGLGAIDISTDAATVIWSLNGTLLGISQDLSGLFAGTYMVTAQGFNGCTTTLLVTVDNTVDIREAYPVHDWIIFPNPTNQVLFADLSTWESQDIRLQVYNAQGQRIVMSQIRASGTAQPIALPEPLAAGVYLLEINLEDGTRRSKRFVLQH